MLRDQRRTLFALCSLLSIASTSSLATRDGNSASAPTAQVLNGTLTGSYQAGYDQDFFLGIPYAQAPVNDLRFRPAQSLNTTWEGAKEATAYSPNCIGYGSDAWANPQTVSEDCLALNVIRPAGISADQKLPVGLWIHGGGLTQGGSQDPRYNLSFIVQQSVYARSPFIAVSINYRLQAWGFLSGQEVLNAGSSNLGTRDQRLALQWIQENIAAFGGDPTKVTVWGESAGASSIGVHLIAYGGRDDNLFRGAILESGAISGTYYVPSTWQKYYDNITAATNCSSAADSLACLRTVPVDVLSSVFNSTVATGANYGPSIDGDLIQGSGTAQLRAGNFVKVPLLNGRNHDEGTSFSQTGIDTDEQFLAYLASKGYDNATSATLAALYPDIPEIGIPATETGRPSVESGLGQQWKRVSSYANDMRQHAPRRLTSQQFSKWNVTNYSYHFNVFTNGFPATTGVTHFTEVAFMMHNVDGLGYQNAVAKNPFEGKPETYKRLATMMSRMWVSFIVDLDPNNAGYGCIDWPAYTLDDPQNIVFDANVTDLAYVEKDIYRAEAINFVISKI